MGALATRLRELRDHRGYSQEGIASSVGMSQATWARWETQTPEAFEHLARIVERYETSADYLLGLSDDPSPRRDAPLPEETRAVLGILDELSEGRRAELLAHARVLYEAEKTVNVREYRRLRAVVVRMPDGKRMAQVLDDALRAGSSGDLAAALAVVDAYLAELAAGDTLEEDGEQV